MHSRHYSAFRNTNNQKLPALPQSSAAHIHPSLTCFFLYIRHHEGRSSATGPLHVLHFALFQSTLLYCTLPAGHQSTPPATAPLHEVIRDTSLRVEFLVSRCWVKWNAANRHKYHGRASAKIPTRCRVAAVQPSVGLDTSVDPCSCGAGCNVECVFRNSQQLCCVCACVCATYKVYFMCSSTSITAAWFPQR